MRLCNLSILTLAYFTFLAVNPSHASIARNHSYSQLYEVSQVNSPESKPRTLLKLGSRGNDVQKLQTQLKQLGYYNGTPNGVYDSITRNAVSEFQKAEGLSADGIAGNQTQNAIIAAIEKKQSAIKSEKATSTSSTSEEEKGKENPGNSNILLWSSIAIAVLGSFAGGIYFLKFAPQKKNRQFATPRELESPNENPHSQQVSDTNFNHQLKPESDGEKEDIKVDSITNNVQPEQEVTTSIVNTTHKTSRLTKVDIVQKLIKDIQGQDPIKRRKAIWSLGQKGDSRAIKPMIDSMVEADSQQRSLILAALAEISDRTLKPMNSALAISLQDDSPEVRKNAIRDITRIYDDMAQISQMLAYALEDSDLQVRETAKYALDNMNRISSLSKKTESFTTSVKTDSKPKELSQDSIPEIRDYSKSKNDCTTFDNFDNRDVS